MSEHEVIDVPSTDLEPRFENRVALREELDVADLVKQVAKIQDLQRQVMKDGEHYGVIPGTDKPTLLKPGAEKLCLTFRLAPSYDVEREWDGEHLHVHVTAKLTHIASGAFMGEGLGMCSTREQKYAERTAARVCPACGAAAIIKGKAEYGGGWLCWKKRDGCGAKFSDGDEAIESQESGKVANDHLADTYNTVVKMAKKRALVDAVLTATAASDIFAQDLDVIHGTETPAEEMPRDFQEPPQPPQTTEQREELGKILGHLEELVPSALRDEDWGTTLRQFCESQFAKSDSKMLSKAEMDTLIVYALDLAKTEIPPAQDAT